MSEGLPISSVTDRVDIEAGNLGRVRLSGLPVHWDAKVDGDWLDPYIVIKFDNLLKTHMTPFRIYSNILISARAHFCLLYSIRVRAVSEARYSSSVKSPKHDP
jgi:hypothetical protein